MDNAAKWWETQQGVRRRFRTLLLCAAAAVGLLGFAVLALFQSQ